MPANSRLGFNSGFKGLKCIAFIVFRELCSIFSALKYLVLDYGLRLHTTWPCLPHCRVMTSFVPLQNTFSTILDFSNNFPILIMSDNFASKNASIKVTTLKMQKMLTKSKLVALYLTLLELVNYQWFLCRSCKFSQVGNRRTSCTQKVL